MSISRENNMEWDDSLYELDEAHSEIASIISRLSNVTCNDTEDFRAEILEDFRAQILGVFAHLTRAWNLRPGDSDRQKLELTRDNYDDLSSKAMGLFPDDETGA